MNVQNLLAMTRKVTKYIWIISLALLFFSLLPASAQRTISGQPSLGLSARYNGSSVGAEAFYSQYTLSGFWEAGLSGDKYMARLSIGHNLDYMDIAAKGGYSFRLVGTRSRSLSLYAGGGAFIGVEWLDPTNKIPAYIDLRMSKVQFLYGLYARAMLEVFLGTHVALTFSGSMPVNFSSKINMLHYGGEFGLKTML